MLYLEGVALYILRGSRRRRGRERAGNKTRIVRESDTQKGSTRYECMCASVRSSDYRTFVCAMRIDVMSYINTPSESMAYCKEDMDSKFGKEHGR